MNKLSRILNELSDSKKQQTISNTIGTVTLLIYSKDIFKNNHDIIPFLEKVFNVSYLPYVIKSRTLICAKIGRKLYNMNEKEIKDINNNLLNYFELNSQNETSIDKKKPKKNANDKLDSWLKGM